MAHTLTHAENNICAIVEVTFCSKNKDKKKVFWMKYFYVRSHLSFQIKNGFYGIRYWS